MKSEGRRVKPNRRKRIRRRLVHGFEFLTMRIVTLPMGWIPLAWHARIAGWFAVLPRLISLRREVLHQNIETVFGDRTDGTGVLVRRIHEQSIRFGLEMARLARATKGEIVAAVNMPIEGQKNLDELLAEGKPFLLASAHLGNWEWMGAWFEATYGRLAVVHKPMHNPRVERWLHRLRSRCGIVPISTREKMPRELIAHLRGGGRVAILADQDAGRHGRFIPFFDRPASTATGLATLAIRLGCPILPGFCLREASGRFRVVTFPPLRPNPAADREAEEERLLTQYNQCVEKMIRRAPAQYFWWHRRWKTQPLAEDAGMANSE